MADAKDFSVSSNEALEIYFEHPSDPSESQLFHPAFTYPIYGEEETIFGYENLLIKLSYAADTLKPRLDITWSAKFDPVGDTKADEVEAKIRPFLPSIFPDPDSPFKVVEQPEDKSSDPFEPPGELLESYEVNGRSFGIWTASLTDPRVKRILNHTQIFIPMFIEGGTMIELDDPEWTIDRWTVFFIYATDATPSEPNNTKYSFAGYATAYRLFFLDNAQPAHYAVSSTSPTQQRTPERTSYPSPDPSLPHTMPSRQRISQFLILPPYQSSGHGSHLYNTMVSHFLPQTSIHEITVEDPNESFDDLRDVSDMLRLRRAFPDFNSLEMNASLRLAGSKTQPLPTSKLVHPPDALECLRQTSKLAPRQLGRLVEMQLLSRIPPRNRNMSRITRKDKATDAGDRAYYFWRLLTKQRLYKHNKELLAQMEIEERIEKLDETLAGVERQYTQLLEVVEKRERRREAEEGSGGTRRVKGAMNGVEKVEGVLADESKSSSTSKRGVKRRVVDDDDDDEDEDGEAAEDLPHGDKRARIEPT